MGQFLKIPASRLMDVILIPDLSVNIFLHSTLFLHNTPVRIDNPGNAVCKDNPGKGRRCQCLPYFRIPVHKIVVFQKIGIQQRRVVLFRNQHHGNILQNQICGKAHCCSAPGTRGPHRSRRTGGHRVIMVFYINRGRLQKRRQRRRFGLTGARPYNGGRRTGAVAQLGERDIRIVEVRGSNPLGSTTTPARRQRPMPCFSSIGGISVSASWTAGSKATGTRAGGSPSFQPLNRPW